MEELIEVLDENGIKTGIIKKKSDIKKDGDFHRAISVCIINSNNEILMHKRCSQKEIYPNLWSCFVRGHVINGETSINACIREVKEELGITVLEKDLKFLYTLKDENSSNKLDYINNIFYDNYVVFLNIKLQDVIIQEEEVSEIKYLNYNVIDKMIRNKDETLIPNWEDYDRIMKYLRNKTIES